LTLLEEALLDDLGQQLQLCLEHALQVTKVALR
jgi:hypothetical protein